MSDLATAGWAGIRPWTRLICVAICIAMLGMLSSSVHAESAFEQRKLPMKFSWVLASRIAGAG
jgi:hypothetical protein